MDEWELDVFIDMLQDMRERAGGHAHVVLFDATNHGHDIKSFDLAYGDSEIVVEF